MLAEAKKVQSESYFVKINSTEEIHLKRFFSDGQGPPVFMVHGSIENGKIFYSSSGKGLAPYLALNGFDVFVADLRGRGLSQPAISRYSKHGLSEILRDDFPAAIRKIKEIKGDVPQHWIAHSYGGVLMLAYIARQSESVKINSLVFFGTKRRIAVFNLQKVWMIDILWNVVSRVAIALKGFLPAKEMKIGSDNETKKSHRETVFWVENKQWLDWYDHFDYSAALKKIILPPALYLAGANDKVLGNPEDIKCLINETGKQNHEFMILGKRNKNLRDYGHNDILSHPDALADVYPISLNWLKKHSDT